MQKYSSRDNHFLRYETREMNFYVFFNTYNLAPYPTQYHFLCNFSLLSTIFREEFRSIFLGVKVDLESIWVGLQGLKITCLNSHRIMSSEGQE